MTINEDGGNFYVKKDVLRRIARQIDDATGQAVQGARRRPTRRYLGNDNLRAEHARREAAPPPHLDTLRSVNHSPYGLAGPSGGLRDPAPPARDPSPGLRDPSPREPGRRDPSPGGGWTTNPQSLVSEETLRSVNRTGSQTGYEYRDGVSPEKAMNRWRETGGPIPTFSPGQVNALSEENRKAYRDYFGEGDDDGGFLGRVRRGLATRWDLAQQPLSTDTPESPFEAIMTGGERNLTTIERFIKGEPAPTRADRGESSLPPGLKQVAQAAVDPLTYSPYAATRVAQLGRLRYGATPGVRGLAARAGAAMFDDALLGSKGVVRNVAADAGSRIGGEGANELLPEDMNPWVRGGLVTGAGLVGGVGGWTSPDIATGTGRAARRLDDAAVRLDRAINEPVRPGVGEPVSAGRAFEDVTGPVMDDVPGATPRRGRGMGLRALDPTEQLPRAYGKVIRTVTGGEGITLGRRPSWLTEAPDAYPGDTVIPLKDVSTTAPSRLPVSAKVSNAFWKSLGIAKKSLLTKADNARVYPVARQFDINQRAIPGVARTMAATAGADIDRVFKFDAAGAVLDAEGKRVPLLVDGLPVPDRKGGILHGAGLSDITENAQAYLDVGLITQEQADVALRFADDVSGVIYRAQQTVGVAPKPTAQVGAGGKHLPRGNARPAGREKAPASFRGEAPRSGSTPGASKRREFQTQAHGIARGYEYPHPTEAAEQYIAEALHELNATHAANQLRKLELPDGEAIGAAQVSDTTRGELADLRRSIKPAEKELRGLKGRKAIIDRDVRLSGTALERAKNRLDTLAQKVADTSISAAERHEAAEEALTVARDTLKDSLDAARSFAARTSRAAGEREASRVELQKLLRESRRMAGQLDAAETRLAGKQAVVDALDAETPMKAWRQAERLRQQAADEAARLERRLLAMPYDDVRARYGDAEQAVIEARAQFTGAQRGAGTAANQMLAAARTAGRTGEQAKAALAEGRFRELERSIRQRSEAMARAVEKQSELARRIEELTEELMPLQERRRELLQDVATARRLARDRKMTFTAEINLEPLRGVKMPASIANAFNKYLAADEQGKASALFDLINNLYRMLGATADISRPLTTGLLGAADNPVVAARGYGTGVRALRKSSTAEIDGLRRLEQEAVAEGLPSLRDAIVRHGLELAPAETSMRGATPAESLSASRLHAAAQGEPLDVPLGERVSNLPPFRWADTMYSVPANRERILRYYATLRRQVRAGKEMNDSLGVAAANAANTITGRASRGVIDPFVGSRGTSRVVFAGRFVQSQIDVVMNALLSGGIEGDEARRALLRLGLGVGLITYVANEVQGKATNWDVRDPDGWAIDIGDRKVKLLGPWDSLVRGLILTGQTIPGVPGEGDKDAFARSKMAPVPSKALNLLTGKTGYGFETDPMEELPPLPFGVRDAVEDISKDRDLNTAGGRAWATFDVATNLAGTKSSPLTATQRRERAMEEAGVPTDYSVTVQEFKRDNPKMMGKASGEFERVREIQERTARQRQALSDAFYGGRITVDQFSEGISDVKLAQREAIGAILGEREPGKVYKDSALLDEYYATFVELAPQVLDNEATDAAQAAWAQRWKDWRGPNGETAQQWVERATGIKQSPAEREYTAAMKQIRDDGYWDMPRYQRMRSGLTEDQIDAYRDEVSMARRLDPRLERMDYGKAAARVLREMGLSREQIRDVINAGKKAFQNPEYAAYKEENAGLLAWLNGDLTYEQIMLLQNAPVATRGRGGRTRRTRTTRRRSR